jgi:hypothetical protein
MTEAVSELRRRQHLSPQWRHDIGIVLEDRPGELSYEVCGKTLRCLDHLRGRYAEGLACAGARVVAYGNTWRRTARERVELGDCGEYIREAGHSVQLLRRHTYALVLENCDADGYVSEKLVDALCAGCVPLYYGNNDDDPPLVPKDLYVDLRDPRFDLLADGGSVKRLYHHLLAEVDVDAMRAQAVAALPQVLHKISAAVFTQAVGKAIRLSVALSENDKSTLRLDSVGQVVRLPHSLPRTGRVLVGHDALEGAVGALTVPVATGARPWNDRDEALRRFVKVYNEHNSAEPPRTTRDLLPCPTGAYAVDGEVFLSALTFLTRIRHGSVSSVAANDPMLLATLCVKQSYLEEL